MSGRIESVTSTRAAIGVRPARALQEAFKEGFGAREVRRDVLSGLVVGIVALPLSMALAIASGVPPQHGLYTAIVAGGLIALLGGSRVQVSGPTAAFVVILAPISAKFGVGGLLVATMMAGAILMIMGLLRLGQLIQFIPYPVTTGFTAGIAVVIATLQIKDFVGLQVDHMPDRYIDKVMALVHAVHLSEWRDPGRWADIGIGVGTMALLLVWPRYVRRIPSPLVALPVAAIAAALITNLNPDVHIATIFNRFPQTHGVPQQLPVPAWPWSHPGPDGQRMILNLALLQSLLLPAFAIAMLGAIESLLSAVVSDGMTGFKHDPNTELAAQGLGNLVAPFFGGIAATGAIARTATNIRSGGRSPIASLTHAVFVLLAVLALAPALGYLPMAALAALLLVVAKNMSELKHFVYVLRIGPRSDVAVLLTCFLTTVIFDMVVAVTVGMVLAAFLFMGRMAEVSGVRLVGHEHPHLDEPLPTGVLLYEINGPLFFGAAQKAMSSLHQIGDGVKVVILDMDNVPAIDATGLVNLQSTIRRLHSDRILILLGGVQPQPMEVLTKAGLETLDSRIGICATIGEAVTMARFHAALGEDLHPAAAVATR